MKNKKSAAKFVVAKVSDQINGNLIAWAHTVDTFYTYEAAKAYAARRYEEDRDALPQGGGYIVGYSYIVHDGQKVL